MKLQKMLVKFKEKETGKVRYLETITALSGFTPIVDDLGIDNIEVIWLTMDVEGEPSYEEVEVMYYGLKYLLVDEDTVISERVLESVGSPITTGDFMRLLKSYSFTENHNNMIYDHGFLVPVTHDNLYNRYMYGKSFEGNHRYKQYLNKGKTSAFIVMDDGSLPVHGKNHNILGVYYHDYGRGVTFVRNKEALRVVMHEMFHAKQKLSKRTRKKINKRRDPRELEADIFALGLGAISGPKSKGFRDAMSHIMIQYFTGDMDVLIKRVERLKPKFHSGIYNLHRKGDDFSRVFNSCRESILLGLRSAKIVMGRNDHKKISYEKHNSKCSRRYNKI